ARSSLGADNDVALAAIARQIACASCATAASITSNRSYPKPTPRVARRCHPGLLHETLQTRRPLLGLARRLSCRQSAPPRLGLVEARAALPIPCADRLRLVAPY